MKTAATLLVALLLASVTAHGGLYSYSSGTVNITIPDANPTGISSLINVSGALPTIADVNVMINVSGGYNGDLYAYVSYNGTLVPLWNRVGTSSGDPFGYATAGFNNITLDDQAIANGNIHNVPSPSAAESYEPDSGSASLGNFNSLNPNGNWTIFFADMASGGGSGPSTLVSWSLGITAVPEPVNVALGVFGGILALVLVGASKPVRKLFHRWKAAFVRWVNAV